MLRDAGDGRDRVPAVLSVPGPVAPGRATRYWSTSSTVVAWFLGAVVRRPGGPQPPQGRSAGVRTSRLRREGCRKRGVRTPRSDADASALTIPEEGACPRSGLPFRDRGITAERTAWCPSCERQVALLAFPDGGPGGVYATHELESPR